MNAQLFLALSLAALAPCAASAACIGSDSLAYCSDDSGNTYNVRRLGNTTYVDGNNAQTGSTWSQSSQTLGNTTYHQGTAANGNYWNGTTTNLGGTTYHQGTDSRGNYYSKTCNQFGCF